MKRVPLLLLVLAATGAMSASTASGAGLTRVPNTTLRLPLAPPVFGYSATPAFGNLAFSVPVAITSPPGETNRLFIVEQRGRIAVITNLANPTRTVFLDITGKVNTSASGGDERGLLGLAFHPGYATNRYFYVAYSTTTTTPAGNGAHQRLARFEASPDNPNAALPASELPLISQYDEAGNHNGGEVQFGRDGYLYLSLGDEGGGNDQFNNSQRIDKDFYSGIIRIDVDKRTGSLPPNRHTAVHTNANGVANYAVPADNPFVGATNFNTRAVNPDAVRTEFWAVGLRNPWRFSFDRTTGTLYCGDVGQDRREEINVIVKGGNYGWGYVEGTIAGPKSSQAPAGFTSIPPIVEYSHGSATNQGSSVTGGVVYRGLKVSQLAGAYVFADYVSGNVWMARPNSTNVVPFQYLFRENGISAFGTDPVNSDILMASISKGTILRLVYNTNQVTGARLPETLAATGAFADLPALTPQAGIVPYTLNVPFWSDHAFKQRWFSVPDPADQITFNRDGNWTFPAGAVWIKHFELELTNGVPASRRRLETRLLVRGTNGVYGLTYRWGNGLADAALVPEEGLNESLVIHDGDATRTQTWRYPARSECLSCHSPVAGGVLGFRTGQLNADFDHGAGLENQIQALSRAGYLQNNPGPVEALPVMAHATNTAYSLEHRVRSYLAANCSQCHQPGGGGIGNWDARFSTPLSAANILNGALRNPLGTNDARVIKPGSLADSAIHTRISLTTTRRMPPLATSELNHEAIQLLADWIQSDATNRLTFATWQTLNFGSTNAPESLAEADPDQDGLTNLREFLFDLNPRTKDESGPLSISQAGDESELSYTVPANRLFELQVTTDLASPQVWAALDVPGNRPVPWSAPRVTRLRDSLTNTPAKYYRLRASEP